MPPSWKAEPIKAPIEQEVLSIARDLEIIKLALEVEDWSVVRKHLNIIHLGAKEQRDYLYRCEGAL